MRQYTYFILSLFAMVLVWSSIGSNTHVHASEINRIRHE